MPVSNVLRSVFGPPAGTAIDNPFASGSGIYDADVLAWISAVEAQGGAVSTARGLVVQTFVQSEKSGARWPLTCDYLAPMGENAVQARTSLKQRRLATLIGTPTFSANRGYTTAGSNGLDTGFIPDTHATAMGADSVHLEAYDRVNANSGTTIGAYSTASRSVRLTSRNSSNNALGEANSAVGTFTLPAATAVGLTQIGRSGGAATDAYGSKNGVAMTRTGTPASLGATLPSVSLYIGGLNNVGTFGSGRVCQIGFAAWGAALTDAQRLARYTAFQAWATAVGA
jgi:hypothetical protein